jgi:hypothetical protein
MREIRATIVRDAQFDASYVIMNALAAIIIMLSPHRLAL